MNLKPVILVARKLPDAVEARLKRDYSPILNPDDKLYSEDEMWFPTDYIGWNQTRLGQIETEMQCIAKGQSG